jgi:ABC-type glycerol-3-phosphate transport system substrate-binding protein
MSKKYFIRLITILAVISILLVACGPKATPIVSPPTQAPATQAPATQASAEKVQIKIWTWEWAPIHNFIDTIISEFEAANPNIDVVYETLPGFGEGSYNDKLRASFATGDTPDVFFIQDTETYEFVSKNLVREIDSGALTDLGATSLDELKARYEPGVLEGWAYQGHYYGIPNEASVEVGYVNTQQLKEAGIDPATVKLDTWEDVVAVAKQTIQKDANGNFTRVGFRFELQTIQFLMHDLANFTRNFGGSVLNADTTKCTLNQPEGVKALEYYLWLTRPEGAGVSDPSFGTQEGGAWQADWAAGLSTFVFTNPAATIGYAAEGTAAYNTYMAFPMPYPAGGTKSNVIWGWGWVVPNNSKHPAEAWKFISFMMKDPERVLRDSGFPPGTKGLGDSETAKSIPAYAAYGASMEGAAFEFKNAHYTEIANILLGMMQTLGYQGGDHATVQAAADAACAQIDQLLK